MVKLYKVYKHYKINQNYSHVIYLKIRNLTMM